MKLVHELNKLVEDEMSLKQKLQAHLSDLGYEGVVVSSADVNEDGSVEIDFVDEDGDEMSVILVNDEEEGAEAIIVSEEEDDELTMVDLDALEPPLKDNKLDMSDLSWLNTDAMDLIFSADDEFDPIEEKHAFVVRGGKKVKVGLARRKRKKRMTAKQRQAVRKAVRTRRKKKTQIARKRKKSLKVRKRMGLKKTKNKSKYLVRK